MKNFPNALRVMIGCLAVLVALTACSSTGGKPRATDSGMGAGQADTPRFTIAMVTHEADVAGYAERTIRFLDGHVASDTVKREMA